MSGASNLQPVSLTGFLSGWAVCTLVEMLTSVPVVDISCVVNDGFPCFHKLGSIAMQGFGASPEVGNYLV